MAAISKVPKGTKKQARQRNTYTAEQREKARKYYLMGLNMEEISKLLDGVPIRTLEKWQISEQWTALKNSKPIKMRAFELKQAGKTMDEICKILEISRATAFRYINEVKETKQ